MTLSPQSQAILLLTCSLGKANTPEEKPLTNAEWSRFATWLRHSALTPADFLEKSADNLLQKWSDKTIHPARVEALLNRGAALGLSLEKWQRAGLWVLTRSDPHYPKRLKQKLKEKSPPVIFGCGPQALLDQGGLAIVGSRNATDDDLRETERLGQLCAANHASVVSGGARGVDQTAMLSALRGGGQAVGIMSDNLLKAASSSAFRSFIMSGDLTLISPFKPEARFHVGNAMARNKYIYCLADGAVAIASALNEGGTWAGAQENLKENWVPLWVRRTKAEGTGNEALVAAGATWLPEEIEHVQKLYTSHAPAPPKGQVVDLFGHAELQSEAPKSENIPETQLNTASWYSSPPPTEATDREEQNKFTDYFGSFVTDIIQLIGDDELNADEISEALGLHKTQVNLWLKRAVSEDVLKKLNKPVRYQIKTSKK